VIDETACQRRVRLGMAQPCLSGENVSIRPHQYRFIAEKTIAFARNAAARQITLEFDCGFVRCMFTDDELAFLEGNGSRIGWHCNPILDIDAHNQVIHCYPLTGVGAINLDATSTATTLRAHFSEQVAMYRQAGIFPECINCPLKQRGECTGGCLAVTMRRFRHSDFAIQVAEQETL
jgi:hypothetical protein